MRIKFLFLISILFSKPLLAVPESFADLVEQLSPAVVSIASTTIVENNNQNQIPQFPEGSPFDDFFKEYFDRDQRRSQRPMSDSSKQTLTFPNTAKIAGMRKIGSPYSVTVE